jgi:hypothetical protein
MLEILAIATYLVTWSVCKWGIGIQSGLISLIISVSAGISVYILTAYMKRTDHDT